MKIKETGLSRLWSSYTHLLSTACVNLSILSLILVLAGVGLSGCGGYTAANTQSIGSKTLSATPGSLSFGNVSVGGAATQSVTLKNNGTSSVTVSQTSIIGSAFSITKGTPISSIAAGQSVTLQIRFAPSSLGNATGSLTVTSNANNSPATIPLSGLGAAPTPQLTAFPNSVNFGNVSVGGSSSLGLTLQNTGNANVTISGVKTSGGDYRTGGINANTTLTPGQLTTFSVTFTPAATGIASGSISVASNSTNSPATISLTGNGVTPSAVAPGMPSCGISGDTSNHIPTDWDTFVPPAKGQSYVDPTFGCTVTRITDASQDVWNGSVFLPITHGYSTLSPFNANDTYLLLSDGWGRRHVMDLKGNIVVPIANMPTGYNDGWFLWDATNPAVFYYTTGNSLMKGTISGSSVASAIVHQFTEYAAINFMDETDVSQDGTHVVVIGGDNSGSNPENVFVYDLVANTKGPVYTTSCRGVINNVNNGCLHKLIQTPDNNVAIDFASDGSGPEQGLRLWNGTYPLLTLQDLTDHMDTGYDLNGNAVFIESGNSYYTAGITNPCPSGWGLDVRHLNNPLLSVCLVDTDINNVVVSDHVGYRGNAKQPWAVLSFDDQQTKPSPEWFDNNGNYTAPTTSTWEEFKDEVVMVRIDANNNPAYIYRLARGYSRTDEDFNAQLKAAISRDGKYIAFDSNMAYAHTGCPANFQTPTNCSDVYVISVLEQSAVAPTITTQPASQTVTAGQTATFTVVASGTGPLSYQWQKSGASISGATSASYTTPATTSTDNGTTFTVVVSNSAGTVTSNAATLTVNAAAVAPTITTQPASQTVTAGQTATFTVVASGAGPLSYQWQKSGANISGATSASYTTPATTSTDNGTTFTVVVSNSAGTVTSNAATLTVNAAAVAPTITTQPASQTVTAGQTATFSVVASGTGPLSYQWQKSGANISGATSASYTTPATTSADNGTTFTVVVSNSAGTVTSSAATLTVNAAAVAPTITTQPGNQTVTAGQAATFTVAASGTGPLSYQWQKSGANISGATSASYTTPATTSADNGTTFTVVVSNSAGTVTSSAATLTVN